MNRNGVHGLSLRATDSAVALVSLMVLAYALYYRNILLGLIAIGLVTTVYLGYTIGGTRYAAGVFVVGVAFLTLLVILGIVL